MLLGLVRLERSVRSSEFVMRAVCEAVGVVLLANHGGVTAKVGFR